MHNTAMMTRWATYALLCTATLVLALGPADRAAAQYRTSIKDVVRVKGQEENTLRGLGLVVGLNKSGDGGAYLPMIRSLAMASQLLGNPIVGGAEELKDTRNAALVWVVATVPASGARQGDAIDCRVASLGNAKSLKGGRLITAALQGPNPANKRVYAFAEGDISLDDASVPLNGKITKGCRLEENFFNQFAEQGRITLVLDQHHRDFEVAQNLASLINSQLRFESSGRYEAVAIDASNIVVMIPKQYESDPVDFVSQVLSIPVPAEELRTEARVVVNKGAGTVVISGDVEIGAVAITHKNILIDTGTGTIESKRFVPLDLEESLRKEMEGLPKNATPQQSKAAQLRSLVEALNAVQVPASDVIAIIEELNKTGRLYGKLVVE